MSDKQYNSVYLIVRSLIHMDGRGRSRTFQSVYAFNRSMVLVTIILLIVYLSLMISIRFGISIPVGYNPYLHSEILPEEGFEDPVFQILLSSMYIVAWGIISSFNRARKDFRKHFAQYLIADFIILSKDLQEG